MKISIDKLYYLCNKYQCFLTTDASKNRIARTESNYNAR